MYNNFMEVQITTLTEKEVFLFWQTFAAVMRSEFPGYTPDVIDYFLNKIYTLRNFQYWIGNKLKTIIVAKVDGQIVGFAVIDEPYGGVSFCRWLGIKKDYQRKGMGRKLIEAWIDLALSWGCHKVEIASQPEAKGFYEKVGLQLEGYRKLSYFGIDQYIFGKVIGKPDDESMTKK